MKLFIQTLIFGFTLFLYGDVLGQSSDSTIVTFNTLPKSELTKAKAILADKNVTVEFDEIDFYVDNTVRKITMTVTLPDGTEENVSSTNMVSDSPFGIMIINNEVIEVGLLDNTSLASVSDWN